MIEAFDGSSDLERALKLCPDEAWEQSVWEVKQSDPWIWPAPGVQPIPERTLESIQRMSHFWAVGSVLTPTAISDSTRRCSSSCS